MVFSTPDKINLMMHDSVYVCFFLARTCLSNCSTIKVSIHILGHFVNAEIVVKAHLSAHV